MTPESVVEVVGLLSVAFGRQATAETFEVYQEALGDLEIEDARGLVRGFLRYVEKWPSPATLRRMILEASGLLPPDEDEAWKLAILFATQRIVADDVPLEVTEAIAAVGGTWGLRMGAETTIRAQFRDAYRLVRGRSLQASLVASWKGLPLNPGGQLRLSDGRDHDLDHGGGRGDEPNGGPPGEAGPGPSEGRRR